MPFFGAGGNTSRCRFLISGTAIEFHMRLARAEGMRGGGGGRGREGDFFLVRGAGDLPQ